MASFDSTGFSTSTYLRWRDMTDNIETAKRAVLKLHCLIQLPPQHPLRGGDGWHRCGCSMLRRLVKQLGLREMEEVALDSAYLSRRVCTMLAEREAIRV